ncbi:MAG: hypothetical protein MESAZ_01502 [Saezia sanguinis]
MKESFFKLIATLIISASIAFLTWSLYWTFIVFKYIFVFLGHSN